MPVKAVIFDMDETLTFGYDSERREEIDIHYIGWQAVLEDLGKQLSYRQYAKHFRGATNRIIELWLARELDVSEDLRLGDLKEQYYRDQLVPQYLSFRPDATACLETLRSDGIELGILTSAPRENVLAAHQTLNFWDRIKKRFSLDVDDLSELNLKPKPAADGLLEIQRRLDLTVDQLVYIGDSRGDMQAARSARMKAIGFVAGNDAQTLLDSGAVETINNFSELLPCLRTLDDTG